MLSKGLKSLLQHYNLKASVLWCSAFFMVQLSHPYMTTGKTIALNIQTFVSKVMSLLFNTWSRFAIAILPSSKLHIMAAVTVCFDFGAHEYTPLSWTRLHSFTSKEGASGPGNITLLHPLDEQLWKVWSSCLFPISSHVTVSKVLLPTGAQLARSLVQI